MVAHSTDGMQAQQYPRRSHLTAGCRRLLQSLCAAARYRPRIEATCGDETMQQVRARRTTPRQVEIWVKADFIGSTCAAGTHWQGRDAIMASPAAAAATAALAAAAGTLAVRAAGLASRCRPRSMVASSMPA